MKRFSKKLLALMVMLAFGVFWSYCQSLNMDNTTSGDTHSPSTGYKPDFAFPDKVAADADILLKQAIDTEDGQAVVKSLVCYSLARNAISPDLLPPVIEQIDSIRLVEKAPCIKSLLSYLEAVIYYGIYSNARWKYDNRKLPADTVNNDYTEWSGEQFKKVISELLNESATPVEELAASSLNDWKDIVVADEVTLIFYPSLYDLIAYNAIDIFSSLSQSRDILPIRFLESPFNLEPIPTIAMVDEYSRSAHNLCLSLVNIHRGKTPCEIMAQIKAIDCMTRLVYQNSEKNPADSAYMKLYRDYADTQWGAEALLATNATNDPQYISVLQNAISRFPHYFRADALKQRVADAQQRSARFQTPEYVAPGTQFNVNLSLENTNHATVYLLRSDTDMRIDPKSLKLTSDNTSRACRYEMSFPSRDMPYCVDTVMPVTVQDPGYYYIWMNYDGQDDKDFQSVNTVIKCSDIAPLAIGSDGTVYPYAVSSTTGQPLEGVTISSKPYNQKSFNKIGVTSIDGTLPSDIDRGQSMMIERSKSAIRFSAPWTRKYSKTDNRVETTVFTSLPLYHHGDTVDWAIVSIINDNGIGRINKNSTLTVKLLDTNNIEVTKKIVETDEWGRAAGKFILPENGLSGYYRVQVTDGNDSFTGYGSFLVNDYKLPTFDVTITDIKRSLSPDSLVTINCKAETYSGFPIAGARVSLRLEAIPHWRWYGQVGQTFWTCDTVTGIDGNISINLSDDILKLSPIPQGLMQITFDITSQSGETQCCNTLFSTGKPYSIIPSSTNIINLDIENKLKADVVDASGNSVSLPLQFHIMSGSDCIASFRDDAKIPSKVPTGVYDIRITPADTALADEVEMKNIVFYRNNGPVPVKDVMFLPCQEMSADKNWIDIPFGCSKGDANILVCQLIDGKLEKRNWFKPSSGMQYYHIEVPSDCNQIEVVFLSMYDCEQQTEHVIIKNISNRKTLNIEVESFRDKVVPGSDETITLRVKENGIGKCSSVIMGMESKSILALAPHSFSIDLPTISYQRLSVDNRYNALGGYYYTPVERFSWPGVNIPQLQLYGMGYGSSMTHFSRPLLYKSARMAGAVDQVIVDEEAEMTMETVAVANSAMAAGATKFDTADSIEEDSGSFVSPYIDDFKYRPSEIPLAFFAPLLQTETDGTLTYTYRVPEANTTWMLQALAYTPDAIASKIEKTVVSSRPVMVNATAPRFLRYGDSITLRATIMNNTDTSGNAVTAMTLFNADNMSVIATDTLSIALNSGASSVVQLPIIAPIDGQAIILRVKAQMDDYTDGEQIMIPLLPASQPIITSRSFYLPYSTDSVSLSFTGLYPEGCNTLYLYDNPLWEVITALPSLDNSDNITSVGAMTRIYMASIAKGIMDNNPVLKQALADWLESDRSESSLTSVFERNEDLKQLTLNATPWVRDAMNDSQRLTTLALILDNKNLDNVIRKSIKTLSDCVSGDKGLLWHQGCHVSSMWSTYRVLSLVASLKSRGYMPYNSQLNDIIDGAISYIDTDMALQLKRNKYIGDYTQYAYIRSLFKKVAYSPASVKAIDLTINNILKRWQKESTTEKGLDAIILYHNGYPSMARRLVASIKSFSMNSAEKGTWWDNIGVNPTADLLHTIETVTPGDKSLIQSVAQWLMINKTNQAWNDQAATSATIAALLGALDIDKAVTGNTHIEVDHHTLSNIVSQMPGMTVADITDECRDGSVKVDISKTTSLPVVGSIISHAVMPMSTIKSSSHPSVSIEKRNVVVNETTPEKADTLSIGDRVKVQLIINVKDDLEYVTIIDRRSACMEPVEQLSRYTGADGLWYYQEMTDSETRYFISSLSKGTYIINTDMYIMASGDFASGIATLQSQLNPGVVANSSSQPVIVR